MDQDTPYARVQCPYCGGEAREVRRVATRLGSRASWREGAVYVCACRPEPVAAYRWQEEGSGRVRPGSGKVVWFGRDGAAEIVAGPERGGPGRGTQVRGEPGT